MSIRISVEHLVAHVHTQNSLVKSFIKRLQLMVGPLLMRAKLPTFVYQHSFFHVASLVRIRPVAYHEYSPLYLIYGH